ncbi:MAG: YeeE/YedE family protein [Burkholderiales bacterium]
MVIAGGIGLLAGVFVLGLHNWRLGALFLIGGLLGITLYHGAFGFTAAYRRAIVRRDVSGVTAQLIMIGLASALFAPALAAGAAFGQPVVGAIAPIGLQVAVGSFLFGVGMQLAGGCGSGTLYTLGGGSVRMAVTLIAFCAGGFLASLDMARWAAAPSWGRISIIDEFGWQGALGIQFGTLLLLWLGLRWWALGREQRRLWDEVLDWRRLIAGPWPLLLSAGLLAVLNWLTLLIAGHPWSITWAFTLWGAKVASIFGWDPATSGFWNGGFPARAFAGGILQDVTSIMDIGILLGALTAAGLAEKFAPSLRISWRAIVAAALGGLLMGYGARIAFGCNIGAFFSGAASMSLHGWLWILCAIPGIWLGVRLRPMFGLRN